MGHSHEEDNGHSVSLDEVHGSLTLFFSLCAEHAGAEV